MIIAITMLVSNGYGHSYHIDCNDNANRNGCYGINLCTIYTMNPMCSVDVIVTVDSSIISIVIFFNPLILNMLMIESCCTTMCCVLTFKSLPRNRRRCYSSHHSRRLFFAFH